MLKINDKAPDFTGVIQTGESFNLYEACREHVIILYFYPKDMTSGCTKQAEGFRDAYHELLKHNVRVVGVSKDSEKSHLKFIEKHQLPFDLVADTSKEICEKFECMVEKSMYGRQYLGVERSTFLIDQNGVLKAMWRNVKVPGHVQKVVDQVMDMVNEV